MSGRDLPTLNAILNGTAFVLLCFGLILIKRGRRTAHARVMVCASLASAAFLASYLVYHFVVVPEIGHTRFRGTGLVRPLYFGMFVSHVVLAVVELPLIGLTLWRAAHADWVRHRRIARVTFPIWAYVSLTGVLVYLALYRWNPAE